MAIGSARMNFQEHSSKHLAAATQYVLHGATVTEYSQALTTKILYCIHTYCTYVILHWTFTTVVYMKTQRNDSTENNARVATFKQILDSATFEYELFSIRLSTLMYIQNKKQKRKR